MTQLASIMLALATDDETTTVTNPTISPNASIVLFNLIEYFLLNTTIAKTALVYNFLFKR